ncbi:MAG: D-2-hydroxyacid dehydrogenase [Thermomicrobiales bacterium]|nr:D-2-hydroxyacid dehydrogenase [Thermomicrobiales bacterium]
MSAHCVNRPPLRTLAIATSMTPEQVERLRHAFPDLTIDVVEWPPDIATLREADAAVLWQVRPEWLEAAPRLRWIHVGGAGVDNLPLTEIARHGVTLTNNSGIHVPNMPEHQLALMLAFARGLPRLMRAQTRHEWRDEATAREVFDLAGQTLLLVGMGEVGLGAGERAAALGMRVLGVRRRPDLPTPSFIERVYGVDALSEALPEADHVAIGLPLTEETTGLFGPEAFAAMKPGAYLYNLGRGPIVDTDALIAALVDGRLAGAGLDVTEPEPLPADSPLWDMDNVIITAHTSGASPHYWERATPLIEENIRRYRAGEALRNEVDLVAGY